ncbi:MAG TPA: FKBP-type peptidyl-prolyl cis-trans isomerase [Candidatus Limnocylindrales bacterium]|nr:FKBP-type peptidyl-prolyl cis-trans isomerase [Candidatus Limnocylindrales bacterium]
MRRYIFLGAVLISAAYMLAQASKPGAPGTSPKTTAGPAATATPVKASTPAKVSGPPKTTPSGVQYWDVTTGKGAEAVAGKKVSILYTCWLADGKQVDSKQDRDEAAEFKLGAGLFIKGLDEGLVGMKVGGRRHLKVPPAAAYGAAGMGKVVPPNATLIFDVELIAAQ